METYYPLMYAPPSYLVSASVTFQSSPEQSLTNLAYHLASVLSLPSDPTFDASMDATVSSTLASIARPFR